MSKRGPESYLRKLDELIESLEKDCPGLQVCIQVLDIREYIMKSMKEDRSGVMIRIFKKALRDFEDASSNPGYWH